jgi:hypothetical protein
MPTPNDASRKRAASNGRSRELNRGKYYLTFPPDLEQQSVICDMYDRLGVKFSIRQAHVGDDMAILGVELLGFADQLRVAEEYLASRGVRVQTVNVAPVG